MWTEKVPVASVCDSPLGEKVPCNPKRGGLLSPGSIVSGKEDGPQAPPEAQVTVVPVTGSLKHVQWIGTPAAIF